MWSHYITTLVITSNNILQNLQIILIYYLFLLNYILNISNLIYLLLKIGFFYYIIKTY